MNPLCKVSSGLESGSMRPTDKEYEEAVRGIKGIYGGCLACNEVVIVGVTEIGRDAAMADHVKSERHLQMVAALAS